RSSPDGAFGLYRVSVETGEKTALTSPPAGYAGDRGPAFSPDGRALAFIRGTSGVLGDVHLLPLSETFTAQGEPRRLTFVSHYTFSPAWRPDGAQVIFSSGHTWDRPGLRSAAVSGADQPQPLAFARDGSHHPAFSRDGRRLAFARLRSGTSIWRIGAVRAAAEGSRPEKFISSTRTDNSSQFSPDGLRIAFASDRSGSMEIWVCDRDGSNPVQLTSLGAHSGSPRWSPDAQSIVFDSTVAGHRDIYVVSGAPSGLGGKPRRLTAEPSQDFVPSWSRDGRWIYYASDRSGQLQIWRRPAGGGEATQVTRDGGCVAVDSADGKTLYYTKTPDDGPLFRLPLEGGEESQVLESVHRRAFAVTRQGLYFIPVPVSGVTSVQFFDVTSGKSTSIAKIDRPLSLYLTVSPDGRTILYSQQDETGSDLMLVENFK
ncbi:MAG: DUF5050 domain-containing protein, partial [Armatimonadota bacterium]|nr:DUF5050 domain-containing protein [Armatimonadota bacterium]